MKIDILQHFHFFNQVAKSLNLVFLVSVRGRVDLRTDISKSEGGGNTCVAEDSGGSDGPSRSVTVSGSSGLLG